MRSASTMPEPHCRIPSYRSRRPPLKPRQQASTTSGSPSRAASRSACAVLAALSGYHTCPACARSLSTASAGSGKPGSPGMILHTERVCVATTPTATPPSRARPTTTVRAQPPISSTNEPASKRCATSASGSSGAPAAAAVGGATDERERSAGVPASASHPAPPPGSRSSSPADDASSARSCCARAAASLGARGESGRLRASLRGGTKAGTYSSQPSIRARPSLSSATTSWLRPLRVCTRGPPSSWCEAYTS